MVRKYKDGRAGEVIQTWQRLSREWGSLNTAITTAEVTEIVPLGISLKFRGAHDCLLILKRWVRSIDEEQVRFVSVSSMEELYKALQAGFEGGVWKKDKYSKLNG
jgi:hypothetical protein